MKVVQNVLAIVATAVVVAAQDVPTTMPSSLAPSMSPTIPGSGTPTVAPSPPTMAPSASPTRPSPPPIPGTTSIPTAAPTPQGTAPFDPTKAPTSLPTTSPTRLPTSLPTSSPTVVPGHPTRSPTPPTAYPTAQPTTRPPTTRSPTSVQQAQTPGGFCDETGMWNPYPDWDTLYSVSLGFACIGALLGLAGFVFLTVYRDRPIIKMSQVVFLQVFCIAITTLNVAVMILVVGEIHPSDAGCMASWAILELSLAFIVTALGMKEWRAWKVRLKSLRFQKVKIGNGVLYGYIAAAIVILLGIIIPWFVVDPPKVDNCKSFTCTLNLWVYVSWGYLILLVLLTTGMAFVARDVPSVGAEASGILYTSLFIAFILIILALILSLDVVTYKIQVLTIAFGVMWISACYVLLIVFRKFAWINRTREEINAIFLSTNSYAHTTMNTPMAPIPTPSTPSGQTKATSVTAGTTVTKSVYTSGPESETEQFSEEVSRSEQVDPTGSDSIIDIAPEPATLAAADTAARPESGAYPLLAAGHSSAVEDVASGSQDELLNGRTVDELVAGAFKIAEKDGWEEYVDRESGESFWLRTETNTISQTPPNVFAIDN